MTASPKNSHSRPAQDQKSRKLPDHRGLSSRNEAYRWNASSIGLFGNQGAQNAAKRRAWHQGGREGLRVGPESPISVPISLLEYNPTERTAPRETESVSEYTHIIHTPRAFACALRSLQRGTKPTYSTNEPHLTPHNRQSAMPLSVGTTHTCLYAARAAGRDELF